MKRATAHRRFDILIRDIIETTDLLRNPEFDGSGYEEGTAQTLELLFADLGELLRSKPFKHMSNDQITAIERGIIDSIPTAGPWWNDDHSRAQPAA